MVEADLGTEDALLYDSYDDESLNVETFLSLNKEPEVTPDWGNQYWIAEIKPSRGNKMTRGQVVHLKHDSYGNPMGRSNQPDTCLHEVEFPGDEITELVADTTAESMYAECDVDWNKYLSSEEFIDHKQNDTALSVDDQK